MSSSTTSSFTRGPGRARAGVKFTTSELDEVGQGRVWTGEQAFERRLVDEHRRPAPGARHRAAARGFAGHAPIVELPVPESSLLGRLLGVEGLHASESPAALLPSELLDFARALAPFAIHPADKLLARIEIVSVGP